MNLRVGVAVVEVDVPVGTPMGGFAARTTPSTGVHDPLTVRALVLDEVALVSVDVCALHEETCRAIEQACDVETVITAAVHTHGGPAIGHGRAGGHDAGVHGAVVDAAIRAVGHAQGARRDVHVDWTAVRGLEVARDRRHGGRPVDAALTAVRFVDRTDGTLVATLVSFPCHPVVLDGSNTQITADYIHPLRARVEEVTHAPCLFLTGAAGDINTGHAASDSFAPGAGQGRTFARAAEIGRRLAEGLEKTTWERLALGPARVRQHDVRLSYVALTQADVDRRRAAWVSGLPTADPGAAAVLSCWIAWADAWTPDALVDPWRGRVTCVDLGEVALVTTPGEPFLAVADALAQTRNRVMVAGYCDGVPGYLPTREAFREGGYEVADACMYYGMPAPFAAGCAEEVVRVGRLLLRG